MRTFTSVRTFISLLIAITGLCAHAASPLPYLQQLDKEIENTPAYYAKKEHKLDSLKNVLSRAETYEARYKNCWALYEEYSAYQLDSAGSYLKQAEVLAKQERDSLNIIRAHLNFSPIFFMSGLYHSSVDLLSDWRQRSLRGPEELRLVYFRQCVSIYSALLNNNIEPHNHDLFARRLKNARDSLLKYRPEEWSLRADSLAGRMELEEALAMYRQHVSDDDRGGLSAIWFFCMARLYEQMGDRENQEKYLALSAISDMRSAVREYRSLADLALMLYEDGDFDRAYRYVYKCLEDANASNSGLRSTEAAKLFPLISSAHARQEEQIKNVYRVVLVLTLLLLLLLAGGLIYVHYKNKLLRSTTQQLEQTNVALKTLADTRRSYIRSFINLCQGYLYKMEGHRKELNKIAAHRNFDELYQAVKSTRYINQEIEDFYRLFDEAFLNIYPHFVEEVNKLLRPEERMQLVPGESMNTELRMLVLFKYGISDSAEVAKFLRCSSSTVYNYRTKMRNRAIDREHFEENVLKIQE